MARWPTGPWALIALWLVASTTAGPLPNTTITEMTTKAPGCAIGDVVYALGEQFTGSSPCERCSCAAEGVRCARRRCEPRAGCKAVHRPDSCCPTYQCECEQDGRVYANGEKLVDPADPCRVCYCQGGEVVCRRIACFVRDDCRPRLVPGRCCPEYDNCPLRGVSSTPGTAPSMPSISTVEDVSVSDDPPAPSENSKPEITIKEITPVSEIPIVTDVKIKEVLPSQSIEIVEYPSSKSPLITREATSEKPYSEEAPVVSGESSLGSGENTSSSTPAFSTTSSEAISASHLTEDLKSTSGPSKITLSTLDTSSAKIQATSKPSSTSEPTATSVPSTTRGTVIEEEDPSLMLDHNPAFPPLPDDFSVLSNHEDDIGQETNIDGDQMVRISSEIPQTETSTTTTTTAAPKIVATTSAPTEALTEMVTTEAVTEELKFESTTSKQSHEQVSTSEEPIPSVKSSPMLDLRSAIPTELLNVPLSESEVINGQLDEDEEITTAAELTSTERATTTGKQDSSSEQITESPPAKPASYVPITTILHPKSAVVSSSSSNILEVTTVSQTSDFPVAENAKEQDLLAKSNIATEANTLLTSQTELSSVPIESSDQNPPETDKIGDSIELATSSTAPVASTASPISVATAGIVATDVPAIPEAPASPTAYESSNTPNASSEPQTAQTSINILTTQDEPITVASANTAKPDMNDNYETTEFMLTSYGSAETNTDSVELLTISNNPEKNAAIIDGSKSKNSNVLNDLIKLVGDVASISDHADETKTTKSPFSESEELIPVNAGYKSKNNNWNLNSITEGPPRSKSPPSTSKPKVVEIEDEEELHVSELPAGDRAEPTTRRPVIDHVSDDAPSNHTTQKDIEIITKSYVPTINRRPTKVVMKKNSDPPVTDAAATAFSASAETGTEDPRLEGGSSTAAPAASQ